MTIQPGTQFSFYHIGEAIGVGGMGEVYRATDTNLKRDVAIKVLPESFAADADRLARFQREAEVLASLNHPNIAQIYGLEKADGITALVMELIPGPTLADRLEQGPVPAAEAIAIAMQIIEALAAAHERGIVHRDLKPANIKLKPDGTVKVLDFGIAKIRDLQSASGPHDATRHTPAFTETGIVLGTAAYMSPEQARGKAVDQRADIWAFGCVLYEMLTGHPAFGGEDVSITLARILERGADLNALPPTLAPAVKQTIALCLEKDLKKRIRDIGDVKLALAGAFEPEVLNTGAAGARAVPAWKRPLPLAAGMLLLGAALAGLAALVFEPPPVAQSVNRFSYLLPSELSFRRTGENVVALAPDGRHFVMNTNAGLYLRSMETLAGRIVTGTEEDLDTPFFSADGQSIAYWTPDGAIKRIGISGGAPVVIARGVGNPLGAIWEASGTILLADERGILRFPATGGTPELLFPVGERERFQAPQLLPDGDTVLYSIAGANDWDAARIVVQSIATGERRVLIEGGSAARLVATGHIVYALDDGLYAMAFDADALTVSGSVVPLVQGVSRAVYARAGLANYGVSNDGTLIYLAGEGAALITTTPVWVDRAGREASVGMPPCTCFDPMLSPDGTRIAFRQNVDDDGTDIWIWSIAQGTFTRMSFDPGNAIAPVWSPDGERIAYGTGAALVVRRADGTGQVESLIEALTPAPSSWSADGDIVYSAVSPRGDRDIGALSVAGDPAPRLLLASPAHEGRHALSPDGRWLAYASDESGQDEVYVRPYPDVDSGRWQVSQGGGAMPQWSADSSTLFFAGPEAMMAATVAAAPTFTFRTPEPLFGHAPYDLGLSVSARGYAVSLDGAQLLMLRRDTSGGGAAEIVIVQNWTEELKRLVPPAK